jgi:hypothetical protein
MLETIVVCIPVRLRSPALSDTPSILDRIAGGLLDIHPQSAEHP